MQQLFPGIAALWEKSPSIHTCGEQSWPLSKLLPVLVVSRDGCAQSLLTCPQTPVAA